MKNNHLLGEVINSWILKFIIVLSIVEGIIFINQTITIPSDSKNSFILNISINRIILLVIFFCIISALGYILINANKVNKYLLKFFKKELSNNVLSAISIYAAIFLVITIFIPSSDFGKYEAFYFRIKPLCLWLELLIVQASLYINIFLNQLFVSWNDSALTKKQISGIFIFLIIFWVFISITKIGLIQNTRYWFEPGVPLSSIQFFGVLFLVILLILIKRMNKSTIKGTKVYSFILILILYLLTIVIWNSSKMSETSYLSFQPTSPNYQPFPDSDAREHDLGALSILKGEGIYFKGYTDKPMYMVLLAVMHLFSNNDYQVLTRWHVIFLSMITPLLYILGKKFIGDIFGLFISLLMIFQQNNAILLSNKIYTTNVKQFGTEGTTLLLLILIVYTIFVWMRTFDERKALFLGGLIGFLSLIRINAIFLLPLCVLIGIFLFKKVKFLFIKQIALLMLSFTIVFSPWLITGTNSEGTPWFIIKIKDVVKSRYGLISELPFNDIINNYSLLRDSGKFYQNKSIQAGLNLGGEVNNHLTKNLYKYINISNKEIRSNNTIQNCLINHFIHNITTSFLSLPDFVSINLNNVIKTRGYWARNNNWDGNFSSAQIIFIVGNIGFLSIGFAKSWRRFRWAGIVPILVFLTYCLSLSFAMHSGGRSIVPINWIIYFYYSIGLYTFIVGIMNFFTKVALKSEMYETSHTSFMNRLDHNLAPTLLILIFIGLIIPFVNIVIPRMIKPVNDTDKILAIINNAGLPAGQFLYGDIVYPYNNYENHKFTFELLSKNEVKNVEVTRNYPIRNILHFQVERKYLIDKNILIHNDSPAIIIFRNIQEKYQPTAIYLINQNNLELIWDYQE